MKAKYKAMLHFSWSPAYMRKKPKPTHWTIPATPEAYDAQKLAVAQAIRADFGWATHWGKSSERSQKGWLEAAERSLAAIGIKRPKE